MIFLKNLCYGIIALYFCVILNANAKQQDSTSKPEKLNLKAEKIKFKNANQGERQIEALNNVEVNYTEYKLCSDFLYLDEKEDLIKAQGEVVLKEKLSGGVLKSDTLFSNKSLSKINTENFNFKIENIFGDGDSASKNDNIFIFNNFILSSCNSDVENKQLPTWQMRAKKAEYNSQKKELKLSNIIFYIKGVPLMWLPFYTVKNKNYGFLGPSVALAKDSTSVETPFFIKNNSNSHYFLFTPSFVHNKTEESKTFKTNYRTQYSYNKNNNKLNLDYQIAPNAYSRNDKDGVIEYKEKNRYKLNLDFKKNYNSGSIGFKYNKLSDRFFDQDYNKSYNNYLVNNAYINHTFQNKDSFINLETVNFTPIAMQSTDANPRINFSGFYEKYWLTNSLLEFYVKPDVFSVSRKNQINQSRYSNSIGLNYDLRNKLLKSKINIDLRLDLYQTTYDKNSNIAGKEEYITRAIPSIFIDNEVPLYFRSQDKRYLVKVAPQVNFKLITENANLDSILNQDSVLTYLNSGNIFSNNNLYGYDATQQGLSSVYGVKFFIANLVNNIKFDFLIGQKVSTALSQDIRTQYSNYVIKTALNFNNKFIIQTDINVNPQNIIQYANSEIIFKIWNFDFSFLNSYISKELEPSKQDVKSNTYGVKFNIPNSRFSLLGKVVQNMNYKVSQNVYKSKIVNSDFSLLFNNDCMFFHLGVERYSYSSIDVGNQYYFTFQVVY